MTKYNEMLVKINSMEIPSDMKKNGWDYYQAGYNDSLIDSKNIKTKVKDRHDQKQRNKNGD